MAYGRTQWSRPAGLYRPCPLLEWNGIVIAATVTILNLLYCYDSARLEWPEA